MAIASVAVIASTQKILMDANDVTTIIGNINTLYTNAFNQIIALTIGLLTIGGVVLPLIIAHFQKKKSSADHETLAAQIKDEMDAVKSMLIADLAKEFKNEKTELESQILSLKNEFKVEISRIQAGANAKTHHHIASTSITRRSYAEALEQCCIAICDYVVAKDESNMQIALNNNLLSPILPNLNKSHFEGNDKLNIWIEKIIQSIEKLNENGRYNIAITAIKSAHKAALNRSGQG